MKKSIINTAKVLVCMTVFAALASTMTSCSKDDEDNNSNRLEFANKLMNNSVSATWEGWHTKWLKEDIWKDESKQYAVIRFIRSSNSDTSGTGVILFFKDKDKKEYKEGTDFSWYFDDSQLKIRANTRSDWNKNNVWMYAEYKTNEMTINGNSFYGYWFESVTYKWEFSYSKSSFNDDISKYKY